MIGSPKGLWAFAIGGSVVLHGAVGMALYAMPMPEPKKPARTEINIASLDAGAATRRAPSATVASVRAERSAVIVQPATVPSASASLAPVEVAPRTATETPQATSSASLEPAKVSEAARLESRTETVAVSAKTAIEPTRKTTEQVAAPAAEAGRVAPTAAAAPAPSPTAEPAQAVATAPETAKPATPALQASPQRAPETGTAETVRPVAVGASPPARTETAITSVEPATPSINTGAVLAARPADAAPAVGIPAAMPEGVAPVTQSPAAVVSPASPPTNSPAAAATAPVAVGRVALPPADTAAAPAIAVSPTSIPGEDAATAVALLPRPGGTPRPAAAAPSSGRLRIADFLAGQEGADCMLALPTGMGATQASIEAFAAAPEAVDRLGAEYERLSGMHLTTDTRPVSRQQCSALAFARSLAQYPNFPLRVSLAEPTIRSGRALSGVISGLRKDTLYLMVVDDEGKAELVVSYPDQRASVMNFSAPMTLTSGPVASVQLLVAIASDGPLRTVPTRPGMPAEEYFFKLATEIIADNRSIAYGITSFVVQ